MNNLPIDMPELQPGEEMVHEIIEHADAPSDTSLGRRLAIQALYELDSTDHKIGTVIDSQLENYEEVVPNRARNALRRFVIGVMENRTQLDSILQKYAVEFPFHQLAVIDRNILRLAVLEFCLMKKTPVGVAIDEAIDLAKIYGAEGSARFVNGVLGSLASDEETLASARSEYLNKGNLLDDAALEDALPDEILSEIGPEDEGSSDEGTSEDG